MADKKSFFQERTEADIRSRVGQQAYRARGLSEKIMSLNPEEALEIRTLITPAGFYNTYSGADASRKCYKHGNLICLSQPKTQEEAYACNDIPLAIRARDFAKLQSKREEEINYIGYSFRPVQGNDQRKRVVPFVWIPEGLRLFAYSELMTEAIGVNAFDSAFKARYEGADMICSVPSREKGKGRYSIKLKHVPTDGSTERRAICWSLCSEGQDIPEHSLYNIKFNSRDNRECSDVFTFYPQDIAAYVAVIKHYGKQHNLTPLEMSPIALPSKKLAEYYQKLGNNVIIYDQTLSSKTKTRKLHIDEKSILIARALGTFGHDEMLYWQPERDGKFKDFGWN